MANDAGTTTKFEQNEHYMQVTVAGEQTRLRTVVLPSKSNTTAKSVSAKAPLAVLIHGLGGQLWQYDYLAGLLAEHIPVLAVDLPGHGRSGPVKAPILTTEQLVEALCQLLENNNNSLPPHSGYVVVGHSMGSIIAMKLAARLGSEARTAVGVAPATFQASRKFALLQVITRYFPSALFDLFRASQRIGGPNSAGARSFLSPETTDPSIANAQRRINLAVDTDAWLRTAAGVQLLLPEDVERISCPILVVAAADDAITPPVYARNLAAWGRARGSTEYVEIPRAGHAVLLEQPRAVSNAIFQFLDKNGVLECN